jgi:hypothetical protein
VIDIVPLFKALADEKRIKIVALIANRGMSIEEIAAAVDLPARSVSHHLARLQEVGLAQAGRGQDGIVYRFSQQPLLNALQALADPPDQPTFAPDLAQYDQKVLSTFFEGGRLKAIPAQQKKRDVILRFLADQFEVERMYDEKEVNGILAAYHEDVASLRRYLVDTGLLERQIVRVVPVDALKEGAPQVEHRIMYWKQPDRSA